MASFEEQSGPSDAQQPQNPPEVDADDSTLGDGAPSDPSDQPSAADSAGLTASMSLTLAALSKLSAAAVSMVELGPDNFSGRAAPFEAGTHVQIFAQKPAKHILCLMFAGSDRLVVMGQGRLGKQDSYKVNDDTLERLKELAEGPPPLPKLYLVPDMPENQGPITFSTPYRREKRSEAPDQQEGTYAGIHSSSSSPATPQSADAPRRGGSRLKKRTHEEQTDVADTTPRKGKRVRISLPNGRSESPDSFPPAAQTALGAAGGPVTVEQTLDGIVSAALAQVRAPLMAQLRAAWPKPPPVPLGITEARLVKLQNMKDFCAPDCWTTIEDLIKIYRSLQHDSP